MKEKNWFSFPEYVCKFICCHIILVYYIIPKNNHPCKSFNIGSHFNIAAIKFLIYTLKQSMSAGIYFLFDKNSYKASMTHIIDDSKYYGYKILHLLLINSKL